MSDGVGYILLVAAIIGNGIFIAPLKVEGVRKFKLDPVVFQLYASTGILASSLLCIPFVPLNPSFVAGSGVNFVFVDLAVCSGAAFMLGISLGFQATVYIGMSLSQGELSC